MDADELRARISASVLRFIASAVLHNQEVAQRVGLAGSDSQFLTLLRLHGPLTPGRLAALTGLSTGTVTGVVDRLEGAGFVRRERDAGDRRRVLVTPVEEALAGLAEHYREHGENLETALRRRTPDELRVLADFLIEITEAGPAVLPDPRPR